MKHPAAHLLGLFLALNISFLPRPAEAINRDMLNLLTLPLEPGLFRREPTIPPDVITPNRISQTGLTPPSLWWIDEQLENLQWQSPPGAVGCLAEQFSNELLSYWLAYDGSDGMPRRVDLLVNQQVWTDCNYLQRYVFINRFGTAARDFGYSTRVFNQRGELLGVYVCQAGTAELPPESSLEPAREPTFVDLTDPELASQPVANQEPCSIFLNPYGRSAFSGGSTNPFGGSSPTNGGMDQ